VSALATLTCAFLAGCTGGTTPGATRPPSTASPCRCSLVPAADNPPGLPARKPRRADRGNTVISPGRRHMGLGAERGGPARQRDHLSLGHPDTDPWPDRDQPDRGRPEYTLALRSNGTVLAWGENADGQLGDGTTTQRHTPVQVPGLTGIVQVSANDPSFAVRFTGPCSPGAATATTAVSSASGPMGTSPPDPDTRPDRRARQSRFRGLDHGRHTPEAPMPVAAPAVRVLNIHNRQIS
jgi:hypothetical protein